MEPPPQRWPGRCLKWEDPEQLQSRHHDHLERERAPDGHHHRRRRPRRHLCHNLDHLHLYVRTRHRNRGRRLPVWCHRWGFPPTGPTVRDRVGRRMSE